jgi:hypothetical protein
MLPQKAQPLAAADRSGTTAKKARLLSPELIEQAPRTTPEPMIVLAEQPRGSIVLTPADEPAARATTELKATVVDSPLADDGVVLDGAFASFWTGYGVGPDMPGWRDNLSTRFGFTYYSVDNTSTAGGTVILESSRQIANSNHFLHAGIGTEYLDGGWPIGYSVGFSRLAVIDGERVTRPLILAFTYDGYFDAEFLASDDAVYLDQFRVLTGLAVRPRLDVGVWAALGLQSDNGKVVRPEGTWTVTGRLADRIAAYAAFDLAPRTHLIWSAGWEEDPGRFFTEGDLFVPLTGRVNLFGGVGYSDSGSYDFTTGLEVALGGRKARGVFDRLATAFTGGDDDCNQCSTECGRAYRGGWTGGVYRGALRTIVPSRMRRMLADPSWDLTAAPAPPPVPGPTVEPPAPTPDPTPNPDPDPAPNPPPDPGPGAEPPPVPEPTDECPERWRDRLTRPSRLSEWLDGHTTT